MKDLKNLKPFELMKMDSSCNTAKFQVRRHNKKNGDNVRLKKINGCAYAYRDLFDLKEVDNTTMYTLIDQLTESLEKIKIIESDQEII